MRDPYQAILAELMDERKQMDVKLDQAVATFALVEEEMNARMKVASPERLQELMQERAQIEDQLGIVDLVERIDALRERIAQIKMEMTSAA